MLKTLTISFIPSRKEEVHFDPVTLVYNASKLAVDRIRSSHKQQQAA
jgi:hypothetical protein